MDVKIKKTCQMAAVISLQRYGDSFSSYNGELTRMHQDKVTSLEAQSQVYKMVEMPAKNCGQEQEKQQITTYLLERLENHIIS